MYIDTNSDSTISEDLEKLLLKAIPHPAMLVTRTDRRIVAANTAALKSGINIGGYCWHEFAKDEALSDEHKAILTQTNGVVTPEHGIQCTHCLSEQCYTRKDLLNNPEIKISNDIWDTYWVRVSDEYFLHYAINVTEQKKNEHDLKVRNVLLKTQIETTIDGILIVNENRKIISYNQRLKEIWQLTDNLDDKEDKLFYKCISDMLQQASDTLERIESIYQKKTEKSLDTFKLKDGRIIELYTAPVVDHEKKYHGRIWYYSDVTERKQAEEALRKSESKYRTVVEQASDGVVLIDKTGKILASNRYFEEMIGQTKVVHNNVNLFDLIEPETHAVDPAEDIYNIIQSNLLNLSQWRLKRKKNPNVSVEINFKILPDGSILAVIRDITLRKEAEEAVLASERFAKATVDALTEHLAIIDDNGVIIAVNQAWRDFATNNNARPGSVCEGVNYLQVCENARGKDSREAVLFADGIRDVLEGRVEEFSIEYPCHSPHEKRWFLGKVSRFQGEKSHYIVVAHENITIRKRAEHKIIESEMMLNKTESIAQFGSWEYDPYTHLMKWSNETYRILGLIPTEVDPSYKSYLDAIHPEDRGLVEQNYVSSFNENKDGFELEYRIINKESGDMRYVHVKCEHQRDENRNIVSSIGFIHDITERKQMELMLIEKERLSAVGELASGVAHDFNNCLQAIVGNVELALLEETAGNNIREYLETALVTANNASARVRKLQRFARKDSEDAFRPLEIVALLDDAIEQTKPKWKNISEHKGSSIEIIREYHSKGSVIGNQGELRTAFYNIINNAIEAMPEGGIITLRTFDFDNTIVVNISDTGIGMDETVVRRVFQPFFSTKGFELGRGLGLSSVYSIIRDHSGNIAIKHSAPDKGTTFEITLPKNCIASLDPKVKSTTAQEQKRSIRVLWVDDEPSIRNLGLKLLPKLGHRADVAETGEKALSMLKQNNYNLLISDVGMPGMTGWQLAELIKGKYNIKVAIVTGWGAEVSDEEKAKYGVDFILGKPVNIDDIKSLIKKVLAESFRDSQ